MSKRKAPKFNDALNDFKSFIGEKEKTALYEQGDSEGKAPAATSDKEVKEVLPGSGETKGGPTDPLSTRGVEVDEKVEGQKTPKEESPERKEVSPSEKVDKEESASDLVNRLLSNIKVAQADLEKTDRVAEKTLQEVAKGDKPSTTDKKLEGHEEVAKADEDEKKVDPKPKEASAEDKDLDALASKIAKEYRDVSVGYELGKFLFSSLGQKKADDLTPPTAAPEAPGAGAPPDAAGGEGGEIQAILQALQELVQEGQITKEQAQQVIMELQSGAQGGAAPGGGDAAPGPEEIPGKEASLFTPEQTAEIEANINAKVAQWVSEGKSDAEITDLVKEAAHFDAHTLSENAKQAKFNDVVGRKVAALSELGYAHEQIEEYVKNAAVEFEFTEKVAAAVNEKVAELQAAGYNDEQINEYLKAAAREDAKFIKEAAAQEEIKSKITTKFAAQRQEKLANLPPEIQQILHALQELLQTGQITEEEATQVLHELGLTGGAGGAAEDAAPDAGAGAPPPGAGAPPSEAPEKSEKAPEKKEPKEEKEEKKEESPKEEE